MTPDYILLAVIAVGVFTLYMALVHVFGRDRRKDRLRLQLGSLPGDEEQETPAPAAFCTTVLSLLRIRPEIDREAAARLSQAGFNSPHAGVYYLFGQRVVQPLLLLLAALVLWRLLTLPEPGLAMVLLHAFGILCLITGGMSGASIFVTNAIQRRQQILLRSFPEAMDLLLVCIESGLGLDAALTRVSDELKAVHPVAAYELARTRLELTMLTDRSQALENLGQRTQVLPFRSLVSALIQTEKFGTSLVDTLRVLSDDLRTSRLLNAEQRAARLPVFITIPLILCILPSFIIIILGPPVVRVIEQGGIFGSAGPQD